MIDGCKHFAEKPRLSRQICERKRPTLRRIYAEFT